MGSGSGSEPVRTTEPAIYIAKKSQKIRTVERTNQRQLANVHEAQHALPESQQKYGALDEGCGSEYHLPDETY
jgi:hypothetical protein